MQDLLSILIDRKDGPLITTFLSFTSANTLLTFRVFRLWENIFNSPSRLSNHLKKHKQNVEWQIRRIYRARNQIIHQGACFAGTRQLIQHLQTYSITINNLVHDLVTHPRWDIEDALEHRLTTYEHFQDRLSKHDVKPVPQNSILNPEKVLFWDDHYAWQG